jgi:hypothetical protein
VDFTIRTMNKTDKSDMEFFDILNLESFKTTIKDLATLQKKKY